MLLIPTAFDAGHVWGSADVQVTATLTADVQVLRHRQQTAFSLHEIVQHRHPHRLCCMLVQIIRVGSKRQRSRSVITCCAAAAVLKWAPKCCATDVNSSLWFDDSCRCANKR